MFLNLHRFSSWLKHLRVTNQVICAWCGLESKFPHFLLNLSHLPQGKMHFHFAAQQSRFRLVSSQKISFESRDLLETQILAHFVCTHLLLIDLIYQKLFSYTKDNVWGGARPKFKQEEVPNFFCHWEPKKWQPRKSTVSAFWHLGQQLDACSSLNAAPRCMGANIFSRVNPVWPISCSSYLS